MVIKKLKFRRMQRHGLSAVNALYVLNKHVPKFLTTTENRYKSEFVYKYS